MLTKVFFSVSKEAGNETLLVWSDLKRISKQISHRFFSNVEQVMINLLSIYFTFEIRSKIMSTVHTSN